MLSITMDETIKQEDDHVVQRSGDPPCSPCADNASAVLSKKEKGRYKKLLKRGKAVCNAREVSGHVNSDDWKELKVLQSKLCGDNSNKLQTVPAVGPSISFRINKSIHTVEGADHRDILHWLLQPPSSPLTGTKRKRDQDAVSNTKLPGWVTIHNPVAAEHIGVLELHIPSSLGDTAKHLEQFIGQLGKEHRKALFQVNTRWFQGPQPQSLSQLMMYVPTKDAQSKEHKAMVQNTADLYKELVRLRLDKDAMKNADYPIPIDSLQSQMVAKRTMSISPSGFTLVEAKKLVKECIVAVDEKSTNNHHLAPYVQSLSMNHQDSGVIEKQPRIFAVDCEMVETTVGLELARVTLVEVESYTKDQPIATKLIWDEIVKPKHRVVNYLTVYSGMTEAIMKDAVIHIEQVQAALLSTVKNQDVLIGHSLENDLKALRFVHNFVVDTAILFQPSHGRFKYSLRTLAARLLKQQIQKADRPHCSEEDAVTALTLACQRAIKGPSFCIGDKSQVNKIHSLAINNGVYVCVGPSQWLQHHITSQPSGIHALSCERIQDSNHKAVCSWLTGQRRRARMVWAQFHLSEPGHESVVAVEKTLQDLVEKLPSNALLLVLIQHGLSEAEKLSQLRRARMNPKSTALWTEDDDTEWVKVVDLARCGSAFWISGVQQADPSL